jgi:two-component system response regulator HydG
MNEPIQIDTRFICATNRDLQMEVNAGRFRRDLYYRLGVIHIELPPLRERGDDVILLAQHFLQTLQRGQPRVDRFSDEALDRFRTYHWPGNIRELRNAVERAIALARTHQIEVEDLPTSLDTLLPDSSPTELPPPGSLVGSSSREEALDEAERVYLTSLLRDHHGNVSHAAQQAGLSRQGMHKLLKKHGIAASDFRT